MPNCAVIWCRNNSKTSNLEKNGVTFHTFPKYLDTRISFLRKSNSPEKKKSVSTGFFRDGERRIDLMVVVADDDNAITEVLKVQFFINAIKSGLQLECEPGVIVHHSNLLFIKVHAPDNVLRSTAEYYDMNTYFKESRLQFMKTDKTFVQKLFPCMGSATDHERKWIKILRAQYGRGQYSNIERSRIVYQMLINLPYGKDEHDVGILRLLANKTLTDMYALHDGPYFYVNDQDMWKVNARQLLYYNWARKKNIFKFQPLNLVHEYFGDSIGLFFAFFSFYNYSLIIAAVVGIIVTICEFTDQSNAAIVKETCQDNVTVMCPQCRRFSICPFKNLSDFCISARLTTIIDSNYTFYYSIFVSAWGIYFTAMWRRKENYWAWLWELNIVETIRPDYAVNYETMKKSSNTGIQMAHESRRTISLRTMFTFFFVFACVLVTLCIIGMMLMFKYWIKMKFTGRMGGVSRDYMISIGLGILSVIMLVFLDICCRRISYTLTAYENHRYQSTYERSLIFKLYFFSAVFTFSMLFFFAYVKRALYTYPSDPSRWYMMLGIAMMTCSPFGCVDDVCILLGITVILKQLTVRAYYSVIRMRTDYNESVQLNTMVPCWEREYRLKPVTVDVLIGKYRELVVQFGLLTLFVVTFPPAPSCALLSNILDMRYKAREFLLGRRRPLFPMSGGLGAWRDILFAVAYSAIIFNALFIALTTRAIHRYFWLMDHKNMEGFLHSTLSIFEVDDYMMQTGPGSPNEQLALYKRIKPKYCYYNGLRQPPQEDLKYTNTDKYWKINYHVIAFVLLYEHVMFALVFILHYVLPSVPRDIQDTLAVENRIKNRRRAFFLH